MAHKNEYYDNMLYWFEVEGLTYALETLQGFDKIFCNTGFVAGQRHAVL